MTGEKQRETRGSAAPPGAGTAAADHLDEEWKYGRRDLRSSDHRLAASRGATGDLDHRPEQSCRQMEKGPETTHEQTLEPDQLPPHELATMKRL